MRLGLGTAGFGASYGVARRSAGAVEAPAIAAILRSAAHAGVDCVDTAPAYGDGEAALGEALWAGHPFRIVTKTPVFRRPIGPDDGRAVRESLDRSRERLGQERLYGVLVHDADDLLAERGEALYEALAAARERGEIERIGASVYDGAQIDGLLGRFELDLLQLPLSVLDQRPLRSGHLERLRERGVEVHARSLFLQGLWLADPESLPVYFDPVREHLRFVRERLRERGLSPLAAALGFVAAIPEVDVAICGVESCEQLEQIVAAAAENAGGASWSDFALHDPAYVDPRRWP